jgi:hypothetical protein
LFPLPCARLYAARHLFDPSDQSKTAKFVQNPDSQLPRKRERERDRELTEEMRQLGKKEIPYFLSQLSQKKGSLLLLLKKLQMIDLVGYSLSPYKRVPNQKDSIDGALPAFPTLEDVARDFDATKDEQQAELSIDDVGRFFKQDKKRVTWTFLGSDGKQHTVSLLWNKRSGKITVAMDDEEVWYGQRKGFSVISHKWESKEGMSLHLFASRVTLNGSAPGFRKYALVVENKDRHLDFANMRWSLTIRVSWGLKPKLISC